MRTFLSGTVRVTSCILLPVGSAFFVDAVALLVTGTRPFSLQAAFTVFIAVLVLCILPIFLIYYTPPFRPNASNKKLIATLILIGIVPAVFIFVVIPFLMIGG